MSLLTVNIIVTSNKGRICNVSLGLVNDLISLFFTLDPCFVLQKKANSNTSLVEMEASSFQSFGIPRGNLCLVV